MLFPDFPDSIYLRVYLDCYNMSDYVCEYCRVSFRTSSNLSRHQKRAKYCLQRRGMEVEYYTCHCNSRFTRKDDLRYHQQTCVAGENNKSIVVGDNIMLKVLLKIYRSK